MRSSRQAVSLRRPAPPGAGERVRVLLKRCNRMVFRAPAAGAPARSADERATSRVLVCRGFESRHVHHW